MSNTVRIVSGSLITLAMACGAPIGVGGNFIGGDGPDDGGVLFPGASGGTGGSGGSAGTGGGGANAFVGVPCDVATLLSTYCVSCHSTNNTMGIPALVTRNDLLAASPSGASYAARALVRMQDGTMPTSGGPVPAADQAALQNWINAGLRDSTCSQAFDAGVVTPICTSGTNGTTGESKDMNPGRPCKACHAVQEPFRNYGFMGTAYPTLHELDQCNGLAPANAVVEILDANGNALNPPLNLTVRRLSGNFMSNTWTTSPSPYRARVKVNGQVVSTMNTPQTDGDCNTCHSETGSNGAPGRITY